MTKKDFIGRMAVISAGLLILALSAFETDARAADLSSLDVSVAAPDTGTDAADGKCAVVFGADLSDTERTAVLEGLGLTEDEINGKGISTAVVTNSDEHKYLDAYLGADKIGKRALTSVKLTLRTAGAGISVKTSHINYCTDGMFRNALITAGVQDADICVAAPVDSSGTAGIIGALKAYSLATGKTVSDDAVETAVSEIVTTGKIEDDQEKEIQKSDSEALMIWLKTQMTDENKGDDDSDAIGKLIDTGLQKFDISLNVDDRQLLTDLMGKWEKLGLNADYIRQQADRLYRLYGQDVLEKANHDIDSRVKKSAGHMVQRIFEGMGEAIGSFFRDLLGNVQQSGQ